MVGSKAQYLVEAWVRLLESLPDARKQVVSPFLIKLLVRVFRWGGQVLHIGTFAIYRLSLLLFSLAIFAYEMEEHRLDVVAKPLTLTVGAAKGAAYQGEREFLQQI